MKNLYAIFALVLATTLLFSCDKKITLDKSPDFMILPIHNGTRLTTQELEQATLSYVHLNAERKVKDFKRASGQYAQKGVISSNDVVALSAVENIKNYKLEIPGYEAMEIVIDAEHLSEKDAVLDPCYCDKPIRKVSYDGEALSYDNTSDVGAHVYRIYLTKP